MIRKLVIPTFLAAVICTFAHAQTRPDAVVTTEWLAQHANDKNIAIVHVGRMNDESYAKGHIPGARLLSMDKIAEMQGHPGTELLPIEQEKQNLEEFGLTDKSHVVVYSPLWDPLATRFLWTLDYLGFKGKASFLEGGLQKWTAEKRPLSTDTPAAAQRGSLTVAAHPEVLVKLDQVNKWVAGDPAGSKDALIDSRPTRRYTAGHIPGAQDFYWEDMLAKKDTRT